MKNKNKVKTTNSTVADKLSGMENGTGCQDLLSDMTVSQISSKLHTFLAALVNLFNKYVQLNQDESGISSSSSSSLTNELSGERLDKCIELIENLDINQINELSSADVFNYFTCLLDKFNEFLFTAKKNNVTALMSSFNGDEIYVSKLFKFLNKLLNVYYTTQPSSQCVMLNLANLPAKSIIIGKALQMLHLLTGTFSLR
jgi:hypothetical protein